MEINTLLEAPRKNSIAKKPTRGRGDQFALDFSDEVHSELLHSSNLISTVATLMDTSDDLVSDIQELEQQEGVSTTPARRYLFDRGPAFTAKVDGLEVEFSSRVVRTYSADTKPTKVRLEVLSACDDSNVILVGLVWAECPLKFKRTSKPFSLQIIDLRSREKALIDCGRHLGLTVEVSILQDVSTCTLEATHVRAIAVVNSNKIIRAIAAKRSFK